MTVLHRLRVPYTWASTILTGPDIDWRWNGTDTEIHLTFEGSDILIARCRLQADKIVIDSWIG